jgi:NTE family protein
MTAEKKVGSIGSYIGALYAGGCLKQLKEFVLRMEVKKVLSFFYFVIPRSGFLDGSKKLHEHFSMHIAVQSAS